MTLGLIGEILVVCLLVICFLECIVIGVGGKLTESCKIDSPGCLALNITNLSFNKLYSI